MSVGFDSPEKNMEISSGACPERLPTSIVAVKKMVRQNKRTNKKVVISFGEKRWKEKSKVQDISEEARRAWRVGRKLRLISKISDEDMRRQIMQLEMEDRAKSRKSRVSYVSGNEDVCL